MDIRPFRDIVDADLSIDPEGLNEVGPFTPLFFHFLSIFTLFYYSLTTDRLNERCDRTRYSIINNLFRENSPFHSLFILFSFFSFLPFGAFVGASAYR